MGLLDGVLGGLVGGSAASLVGKFIEQQGGISSLVSQFDKQGLGSLVQSWVGTGSNEAINTDQIKQALGSEKIAELASQFGVSEDAVSEQLSQILPEAVDKMTPTGAVSEAA